MRTITLLFLIIGLFLLFFADIAISVMDPWLEMQRMVQGMLTPKFSLIVELRHSLVNTITFALCGLSLGVFIGSLLSFWYYKTGVQMACGFIRSIHEVFWALLLLPAFGLNALCGVLAIAIPCAGIIAKGYSEIFQETDLRAYHSLPFGMGKINVFFYTLLPVLYAPLKHYTSYRFECALRSSALLGFIGLPTIGFHLESFFRKGFYSEVMAILLVFYILIATLKYWYREKIIPFYICAAFLFISKKTSFSLSNAIRTFTYDIVPWPMRKEGFAQETYSIQFNGYELFSWFKKVALEELLPGLLNTAIVTHLTLVCAGAIALFCLFLVCVHCSSFLSSKIGTTLLIVMRTTPEYILAYIFIQLWGPSMLPAIIVIALHNGAIVAHLSLHEANSIRLPYDVSKRHINRFSYGIAPKIYGTIVANLLYRWEVMIRESALLGILGVYTIGFYLDSAIAENKIDKAFVIIVATSLFTIGIDRLSLRLRKYIALKNKIVIKG